MVAVHKSFLDHKVTQSSPSPALCFVETVPQDAQNSHITAFNSGDGSQKSDNESSSSKTMRDVHIVSTITACMNLKLQIKIVYFQFYNTAGLFLYIISLIKPMTIADSFNKDFNFICSSRCG